MGVVNCDSGCGAVVMDPEAQDEKKMSTSCAGYIHLISTGTSTSKCLAISNKTTSNLYPFANDLPPIDNKDEEQH